MVRSYLDQLVRGNGLAAEHTTSISRFLDLAEVKAVENIGAASHQSGLAGSVGKTRQLGVVGIIS